MPENRCTLASAFDVQRARTIRSFPVATLLLISAAFIAACASRSARPEADAVTHDVVVYGATPGGIAAAVAARREGKSAVIMEPLPLVGGMLSGGMGFSDSWLMRRDTLGGLFVEFRRRVERGYIDRGVRLPYQVAATDRHPWTSEPRVNQKVFEAMLREAGVEIRLNETLRRVERQVASDGAWIAAIHTQSGARLRGKVFIDASYEGDLLAAANVKYRIGREGRGEFGESLAGVGAPRDAGRSISGLDENGKPMPLITGTGLSPAGTGDKKIQAYNFRVCVTADPSNRVPFAEPPHYEPSRYELFRRMYREFPDYGIIGAPAWLTEDGLPFTMLRLPGNKFDANDHVSMAPATLSLGLVGASWEYPEADFARRQQLWDDHRRYTEGLFHFLKADAAVPERVRARMRQLGYCRDEFVASGHFPPVLYVREGRRMIGEYFMTQADIEGRQEKPDPIGIGSFNVDSHAVQQVVLADGRLITEGGFSEPDTTGPYQIPYRSILPQAQESRNLLVPVALSASHVAFSSLRVEPTWMVLGQSAGIAASIAIEDEVAVQQVSVSKLMKRLEARGQILKLPAE